MKHLSEYIYSIKEKGDYCFTTKQALAALNISQNALKMSLMRLREKKQIVTLSKIFHIIISPEYKNIGILPPSHFISSYMKFLGLPYYICLLSAAEYYGAAHQKPQLFQVMTNKQLKTIKSGKVSIQFSFKRSLEKTPVKTFNVPTGYIQVSTPEVTTMDLFYYHNTAGGLNHIATVLTELITNINPEELLRLAQDSTETAWIQRLGYVLEQIDPIEVEQRDKTVSLLKEYIHFKNPRYVTLLASNNKDKGVKNFDWKIFVNHKIESDI